MQTGLKIISLITICLLSGINSSILKAQEVQISKDFSIRNDFSYELLGRVDERILLFRDRGLSYELEIFDNDLKHIDTRELQFLKRKVNVLGTVALDSFFTVYYSFRDDGKYHIRARQFNNKARVQDTSHLVSSSDRKLFRNPVFAYSENKQKSVLFSYENRSTLNLMVVDNVQQKIDSDDEILFEDFDLGDDFRSLIITDEGGVFLLLEKNNTRNRRKKHFLELCYLPPNSQEIIQHRFVLTDKMSTDLQMRFDSKNRQLNILGLYNDRNKQDAAGYYYTFMELDNLTQNHEVKLVPFSKEFVANVYGQKVGKEETLKHFGIQDIKLRADGGVLMMMEMSKSYSRRSGFNQTGYNADVFASRGWTDYYHEDIVIVNINPNGEELWKEHLHKKQFSQDDEGAFSSFYTFLTPSRMRILYNDEVKKNSTVSEYVMSPVGEYKRNAVLSTDDQNIKLRFRDSLQISNTELLVPSEKSYELSLVKISY